MITFKEKLDVLKRQQEAFAVDCGNGCFPPEYKAAYNKTMQLWSTPHGRAVTAALGRSMEAGRELRDLDKKMEALRQELAKAQAFYEAAQLAVTLLEQSPLSE